uniref:Uncharacterized protein n=1 Tax=Cacopsylla melanoneura TaxID=428564 RepID=A0A8D8TUP8_9HEMI
MSSKKSSNQSSSEESVEFFLLWKFGNIELMSLKKSSTSFLISLMIESKSEKSKKDPLPQGSSVVFSSPSAELLSSSKSGQLLNHLGKFRRVLFFLLRLKLKL